MAYMSGNNQSAVHPSREREQLKTFLDKKLLAMVRAGAGMAYLVAAPVSALVLEIDLSQHSQHSQQVEY